MNNKGFTTVELIVAIAIVGLLMAAVANFMTFNIKGFQSTKDVIDIQYEGQIAMNQLTRIVRESTGILAIEDEATGTSKLTTSDEITPKMIEVHHELYAPGTTTIHTTEYILTYDDTNADNVKIVCDYETYDPADGLTPHTILDSGHYVLMQYIDTITVQPSGGYQYNETEGLLIKVALKQDDAKFDFQSESKFRNQVLVPSP